MHKAFTLMELMIALLLASFLSIAVCMLYVSVTQRFQFIEKLSVMQEDAMFTIHFLRQKIQAVSNLPCLKTHDAVEVFSKDQLPLALQNTLASRSDVLILTNCSESTAYYVGTASWTEHGQAVYAFFSKILKPLQGQREEITPHLVDFKMRLGVDELLPNSASSKNRIDGLSYALVLQSQDALLKQPLAYRIYDEMVQPMDRYLYRVWYGFSALPYVS